jgi:DNA primase
VEAEVAKQLPGRTTSETAHKEARKDKVLLDASIIKPMGDVRAPYSMHFKTGLISMPLSIKELDGFEPSVADPELVVKRYQKRGNEFALEPADGSDLFERVVEWCKH